MQTEHMTVAKKLNVKVVTEFVIGTGRLAFIAAIGLVAFLSLLLLGNFLLYALAHVVDALFDLFRHGIFGT